MTGGRGGGGLDVGKGAGVGMGTEAGAGAPEGHQLTRRALPAAEGIELKNAQSAAPSPSSEAPHGLVGAGVAW